MIPYERVSQPHLKQLMFYLIDELRRCKRERAPMEDNWIRWGEDYKARPKDREKNFPFKGAANLVVPVIATDVDTVAARILGLLFAPGNLWVAEPMMPEMVEYAPRIQEFMKWAERNELDAYNTVADFVHEVCKLGTGIIKTRYKREYRKVYEYREMQEGVHEAHQNLMIHNHPTIHRVALEDFFVPSGYARLPDMPWCAERVRLNWSQLMRRSQAGIYQGLERIAGWHTSKGGKVELRQQELEGFQTSYGDQFELYEFWLDYDIDGDGQDEALVCTIHLDSETYVRLDYNPFFNQEKPYDASRYLRVEGRFYGIGLCEMGEMTQKEVTAMHNQRLDNATLANAVMLKIKRTATWAKKQEDVYPGRQWRVDSMDDVETMQMGIKYDNTIQNEQHTLGVLQRRTGVSDYVTATPGPEQAYGTATTTMAMLREGAKRFDQVMREIRDCLSSVGTRVLELYQQYNQYGKEFYAMGEEDGAIVAQILQFPLDIIRRSVRIDVTATSAALNKEVEIRTNTLLMQMLGQYHMELIQFLGIALNPMAPMPLKAVALQAAQGKSILLRRIFDSYGIQDADRLIPDMEQAFDAGIQQLASGGGLGGGPGAGPAGALGAGGMAGGPPGAPGAGQFLLPGSTGLG